MRLKFRGSAVTADASLQQVTPAEVNARNRRYWDWEGTQSNRSPPAAPYDPARQTVLPDTITVAELIGRNSMPGRWRSVLDRDAVGHLRARLPVDAVDIASDDKTYHVRRTDAIERGVLVLTLPAGAFVIEKAGDLLLVWDFTQAPPGTDPYGIAAFERELAMSGRAHDADDRRLVGATSHGADVARIRAFQRQMNKHWARRT